MRNHNGLLNFTQIARPLATDREIDCNDRSSRRWSGFTDGFKHDPGSRSTWSVWVANQMIREFANLVVSTLNLLLRHPCNATYRETSCRTAQATCFLWIEFLTYLSRCEDLSKSRIGIWLSAALPPSTSMFAWLLLKLSNNLSMLTALSCISDLVKWEIMSSNCHSNWWPTEPLAKNESQVSP